MSDTGLGQEIVGAGLKEHARDRQAIQRVTMTTGMKCVAGSTSAGGKPRNRRYRASSRQQDDVAFGARADRKRPRRH